MLFASDYRLKENIINLDNALSRLSQLQPRRFNWISDDTDTLVDGFLAHEVSSVVPEAVGGEKDGVYPNDHEQAGAIKVQVMDQSKLIPLLTKAIQEQQTTIEALTARIATLEG